MSEPRPQRREESDPPLTIDAAAGLDIFYVKNLEGTQPERLVVVYELRIAETRWFQQAVKLLLDEGIEPYLLDNPRRRLLGVAALWGVSPIRLAVAAEDEDRAREVLKAWEAAGAPHIRGHERSFIRVVTLLLVAGALAAGVLIALTSKFTSFGGFVLLTGLFSLLFLSIAARVSRRARMRRLRDDR